MQAMLAPTPEDEEAADDTSWAPTYSVHARKQDGPRPQGPLMPTSTAPGAADSSADFTVRGSEAKEWLRVWCSRADVHR